LLTTVTRSEIGVGALPEMTLPKLRLERSSEIESVGCTSTSTAALADRLGVDPAEQEVDGERALRGTGATAVKSEAFAFVSLQPPPPRTAAIVLPSAGAGPTPS
jgi:hypothetical protein